MSTLVRTQADYRRMLAGIKATELPVAVDTETTGLDIFLDDHATGVCIAYYAADMEIESWYLPVGHASSDVPNFNAKALITALNRVRFHVYHHALFDWLVLTKLGESVGVKFKLPERFHDTQVMAWLLDENVHHGLKEQCSVIFGNDASDEKRHVAALRKGLKASDIYRELRASPEWHDRPAAEAKAESKRLAAESKKDWATFVATDIAEYGAKDTELTLMLMDVQVGPRGSDDPALAREHALQRVIFKMMRNGIVVNKDAVKAQAMPARQRLDELEAMFEGINLRSTKQLGALIYTEWGVPVKHRSAKTGAPSTSRAALEELEGHAKVRELLEFKRLQKAWSGYYVPLYEKVAADDRIHASFSSTRTVTGRLACSSPNLMTIPRGDTLVGVRDVFEAADGYELWEYDLASAELRIQASLCRDEDLMAALEAGEDLHARTAAMVFGPEFTGLQRRLAKNLNYGFSYGIGPRKFATYMVAGTPESVSECEHWGWPFRMPGRPRRCRKCHVCHSADILQGYRQAYPKLVQLMGGLEKIAKMEGWLPLHVEGRYRHFRSAGMTVPYYTALNAVVQGGVAETMKDVMIEADPRFDELGARLCLQVHDSLVVEVLPGTGPAVGEMLQEVLDKVSPWKMRMLFDAKEWSAHD